MGATLRVTPLCYGKIVNELASKDDDYISNSAINFNTCVEMWRSGSAARDHCFHNDTIL